MRFWIVTIMLLLTTGLLQAQEQTPYEITLERILEAERTGAIELDLMFIDLTQLPPEIGNLSNLQELWLSGNDLTSLPPEIGSLSHLQNLVLYSNELTNLPPEIGNLSHLYTLVLSHNNLHSLPAEVGNLSKLCYLDTGYNQLQHLPTELAQLESLRGMNCEMNVDGNPLISPPQEVIDGGTPAILDYLENQALWHLRRLLIGIA